MRVAVISDIHGNAIALDAVLADLRQQAVERVVCLGDAIQGGPLPAEVVARLRELACPVVLGNADAWLLTGVETGGEGTSDHQRAVRAWSLARLSDADRAFIGAFQPTVEVSLPAGRRLLCFHGSPGSFDDIIFPETPPAEVLGYFGPHLPAILTGGHTHLQQLRRLGGTSFFFNPGSVGFAYEPRQADGGFRADPWAEYAILTVQDDGLVALEFRRVPFDLAAWRRAVREGGMPDADAILARYGPV